MGADGNIARAWAEAAAVCGFTLKQVDPAELALPGIEQVGFPEGLHEADVVLTDGVGPHREALAPYRVTGALLDELPERVLFNPCPPFDRTAEVDDAAPAHTSSAATSEQHSYHYSKRSSSTA